MGRTKKGRREKGGGEGNRGDGEKIYKSRTAHNNVINVIRLQRVGGKGTVCRELMCQSCRYDVLSGMSSMDWRQVRATVGEEVPTGTWLWCWQWLSLTVACTRLRPATKSQAVFQTRYIAYMVVAAVLARSVIDRMYRASTWKDSPLEDDPFSPSFLFPAA